MSDSEKQRGAFGGQLSDLAVPELFTTIVQAHNTGIARFDTPKGRATVWFADGSIIDAEMGKLQMEDAVLRLLDVREGSFEIEFKPITRRRVIRTSTSDLLAGKASSSPGSAAPARTSRTRRAPMSWSPTGGGRGAAKGSGEHPAAPTPVFTPPSSSIPAIEPPDSGTRSGSFQTPPSTAARTTQVTRPSTGETSRPISTGQTPRVGTGETPASATGPTLAPTTLIPDGPPARPTRSTANLPRTDGPQAATQTTPTDPSGSPSARRAANQATPSKSRPTAFGLPIPAERRLAPPPNRNKTVLGSSSHETDAPKSALEEDPSGPISVGTSWAAPALLSATLPPSTRPIESGATSTARGEIQPNRRSRKEPGVQFSPPFKRPTTEAKAIDPGSTLVDGSTPIAPHPGSSDSPTPSTTPSTSTVDDRRPTLHLPSQGDQPPPAAMAGSGSPPATVGRYEVLLRIARGGMGTVYLCRVTGEGGFRRLFALKVIRDHLSRNEEYVKMLLQEARIASRLHHPNVVGIIDIGMLSGQHYLVMDYVEGCTFDELLKVHQKSRPPQLIVPIILDALTGLEAAHTLTDDDGSLLGLVHSDFSPHNMLVGTNGICMISDFGIAKAADALQQSGVTRGKPGYLAPEQIRGEHVDARADIFAAGIVLWNALTGEQLFKAETPEDTLRQVLEKEIPPPSTQGLRPPSCFDAVCLRALQRDPEQRYASAHEMLIELRRIAIVEDLLAPSSDIGRWVIATFGEQLELRRQAAGISKTKPTSKSAVRGLGADPVRPHPQPSIPEHTLSSDASATHAIVRIDDEGGPEDSGSDHTLMLGNRSNSPRAATAEQEDDLRRTKYLLAAAAAMVVGVGIAAIVRPDWFLGGHIDPWGVYVDAPAEYTDFEAPGGVVDPKTGRSPDDLRANPEPPQTDTKTPSAETPEVTPPDDGKTPDVEPPEDGKAPEDGNDDGKADDGKADDGSTEDASPEDDGPADDAEARVGDKPKPAEKPRPRRKPRPRSDKPAPKQPAPEQPAPKTPAPDKPETSAPKTPAPDKRASATEGSDAPPPKKTTTEAKQPAKDDADSKVPSPPKPPETSANQPDQ